MINLNAAQDRETRAYHFRRSLETWHGIVIKVGNDDDSGAVLEGLNKILAEGDETRNKPARADDGVVYSAGNYDYSFLERIKAYAGENSPFSLVLSGSYFDFLGIRWLENARNDYGL